MQYPDTTGLTAAAKSHALTEEEKLLARRYLELLSRDDAAIRRASDTYHLKALRMLETGYKIGMAMKKKDRRI